ncbi:hypothetical protein FRC17_010223 [Serendipita sp. 399]|nr:hypothetical protein FRC17_010223 [Serendipita sp. 399]
MPGRSKINKKKANAATKSEDANASSRRNTVDASTIAKAAQLAAAPKSGRVPKKEEQKNFKQAEENVGLLVTDELQQAIDRCSTKVKTISRLCRSRNTKFRFVLLLVRVELVIDAPPNRDPAFDLENDQDLCLKPLDPPSDEALSPAGVYIWDEPHFFIDGTASSDVEQGSLGDCWFLSALASVASIPGFLDKICVERDEAVGVYGFIFFRDNTWVDVIIDDQLYVQIPKFESLTLDEQKLYHGNHEVYNSVARKGNKALYFARSKTEGETWVPLIEKAYAKLHGSYGSLSGGYSMEGIEDLTGGVCKQIPFVDVLDPTVFWKELVANNHSRSKLYGCALTGVDNQRSFDTARRVHGLVTNHAYTVLKAMEYNGKRFVVIRNPWGTGEWRGRWSDGAKEWTSEWLPALSLLGHEFGDDGQFVMEYCDFLNHWTTLDCTRLFDASWVSSSIWLQVDGLTSTHPWTWGDISYTIKVPTDTPAVIVLQQLDTRYFQEISGYLRYSFEFVVFKRGSKEEYASSGGPARHTRSRSTEVHLEAGEYVVHVRLDSSFMRAAEYIEQGMEKWDRQIYKRVLAQKASAFSKAANANRSTWEGLIPTPLSPQLAGYDLTEIAIQKMDQKREKKNQFIAKMSSQTEVNEEAGDWVDEPDGEEEAVNTEGEGDGDANAGAKASNVHTNVYCDGCGMSPIVGIRYKCANNEHPNFDLCSACFEGGKHDPTHEMILIPVPRQNLPVHEGFSCNTCSVFPIVGTRYRCMICDDFDMCSTCFEKKEHDALHSILMFPVPVTNDGEEEASDERPVHNGIMCDGCNMFPIVGPRFNCLDASCAKPGYDLCEDCNAKGIHSNHKLLRLDDPEDQEVDAVALQGDSVVLGLRVYTLRSSAAVLGGQLKRSV